MFDRTKELFEAAYELPADQRDGFLATACAGDAALRQRLVGLLRAHDEAGDFLEHPTQLVEAVAGDIAVGEAAAGESEAMTPGQTIGNYVLRDRIGRGGFGTVWRAEQRAPVVREVALKILHTGGDSARVVERFHAERQNLARMRHPSIAKVFDAGIAASGQPWMAMELVDGDPLVASCEARRLDLGARLRLFAEVCLAVQHAHSKGVVHRDLKPSNVLVVERDDALQPVVIDFGVACSTEDREGDEARPFGTPEYMSPEQAAGDRGAVDTRTDVHALGVLLYELVGGARPFTRGPGLEGQQELLRAIREAEPEPPSRRPTALPRVPREIDWIVARAMAKDPAARYPTAAAIAEDVQRVLAHEPVSVGPAGPAYRLAKFVRRHRFTVACIAGVMLSTAVAAAVAVHGWIDARAAEQIAVAAEHRARLDQQAAERSSRRAQRALDLLDDLWEAADPARFGRADYPVRELFADFERMLPTRVFGEPEVEFRVRLSLARVQRILGALDRAEVHAQRAVEIAVDRLDAVARRSALLEQARVMFDRGDVDGALGAVETALADVDAAARADADPESQADLLEVLGNCRQRQGDVAGALEAVERAAALRRATGEPVAIARSDLQLANLHGAQGRADVALQHLAAARRTLETLGRDHPDALVAMQHESLLLLRRGDKVAAERVLRECLDRRRELYDEQHPHVAWTEVDLGWLLHEQGRDAAAEPLLRSGLAALRKRLGEHHLYVTESMQRLGAVLAGLGAVAEAEALLRDAAERFRTLPAHPVDGLVGCLGNLAGLLWSRGEREQARAVQRDALQQARLRLPADHFVVSVSMTNLARMEHDLGDRAAAAELLASALAHSSAAGRHGEAQIQRTRLAQVLRELGRDEDAAALEREAAVRPGQQGR